MASDYIQDFAFRQISHAIMATANSVAGAASTGSDGNSGSESSFFDVFRRKLGKVQDVIQGIAAPLKRRSMYEELPEHIWPREQIEMSNIVQRGRGHKFIPCQLTNPTWCDYCGDFIWGLYKQCLRCHTCQYTCHQTCVPSVNLNCKSISDDGTDVLTARTPSPLDRRASLETCLSRSYMQARPGMARIVSSGGSAVTNTTMVGTHRVSVSDFQHVAQVNAAESSALQSGGSLLHQQRQSPKGSPTHQLIRSASEGYVTARMPPYPQHASDFTSTPHRLQGQHISPSPQHSPPQSPPEPESQQSSQIQTNTQGQALPSASPSMPATDSVSDTNDELTQEPNNASSNISDSSSNNNNVHSSGEADVDVSSRPSEGHHRVDGEGHLEAATEKDETDSGYRSGTIPDDKLPKVPSQATLDRQELKRKIAKYNHFVPAAGLEVTGKESFQGFVKVTMNLIRPITMELGARPPSIYELLTREHIVEENTQQVAFYMPRDTHKSLHINSDTTTREVVQMLLKKFHILDHPRKFAMYEQEFNDRNKLVRLRRLTDKDFPLRATLTWDPERIRNYRMVLQENETGEIVWDAFSLPELNNFLKVLDREEKETILELKHKYAYMKQYMERRISELRHERSKQAKTKT